MRQRLNRGTTRCAGITKSDRRSGFGPNHDWSSDGADGFGLMCIHYDQPNGAPPPRERYASRHNSSGGGSWQSA